MSSLTQWRKLVERAQWQSYSDGGYFDTWQHRLRLEIERDAALEALEEAQAFIEREFSNEGICLVCRAPKANHEEMSPSCWVMLLDRILRSKEGK